MLRGGSGGHGGGACVLGEIGTCEAGKKCTVVDEATGLANCAVAGPRQTWSKCSFDGECVDGTWCDHSSKVCKPVCKTGNDCGKGDCQAAADSSLQTHIPGLLLCTSYCNPITAEPCDKSNFVTCVYQSQTFDCAASKNLTENVACVVSSDCAAGLTCIDGLNGKTCRKWCTPLGYQIECSSLSCGSISEQIIYEGDEYGVCAEN